MNTITAATTEQRYAIRLGIGAIDDGTTVTILGNQADPMADRGYLADAMLGKLDREGIADAVDIAREYIAQANTDDGNAWVDDLLGL